MTSNTLHIFESSFLACGIMASTNLDFAKQQFKYLEELEEDERNSWEMIPESEQYFRTRPIGNKPHTTKSLNIPVAEFAALLSIHLTKFDAVTVTADRAAIYSLTIQDAECYGLLDYAILFIHENNFVEHIWVNSADNWEGNAVPAAMIDALALIATQYNFILVDWYGKAIIDMNDRQAVEKFLYSADDEV